MTRHKGPSTQNNEVLPYNATPAISTSANRQVKRIEEAGRRALLGGCRGPAADVVVVVIIVVVLAVVVVRG